MVPLFFSIYRKSKPLLHTIAPQLWEFVLRVMLLSSPYLFQYPGPENPVDWCANHTVTNVHTFVCMYVSWCFPIAGMMGFNHVYNPIHPMFGLAHSKSLFLLSNLQTWSIKPSSHSGLATCCKCQVFSLCIQHFLMAHINCHYHHDHPLFKGGGFPQDDTHLPHPVVTPLSWLYQFQSSLMAVHPRQTSCPDFINYNFLWWQSVPVKIHSPPIYHTYTRQSEVVSSKPHISAWGNTPPSYVNNYPSCSSHFLPCIPIEVRKNNMIHDHR